MSLYFQCKRIGSVFQAMSPMMQLGLTKSVLDLYQYKLALLPQCKLRDSLFLARKRISSFQR